MKKQINSLFSIESEAIDHGEGYWKTSKNIIFRDDKQIGKYKRSYHGSGPVFPFKDKNGDWKMLYSPDYTATSIYDLEKGRKKGGEKSDQWGFCPVEYYVPAYISDNFSNYGDGKLDRPIRSIVFPDIEKLEIDMSLVQYADFGFVAGCVWGDDSSWKIQYLDLSNAHKGKVIRDNRFGYIELPSNLKLKDAINLDWWEDGFDEEKVLVRIATENYYEIKTGKRSDD